MFFFALILWLAMQSAASSTPDGIENQHPNGRIQSLHVDRVVSSPLLAAGFTAPILCGVDGDIYLRAGLSDRLSPISKVGADGKNIATYAAEKAGFLPDGTTKFTVALDGDVFQLAYKDYDRYVLVFKSDGTFDRLIKVDIQVPSQVAAFPSGQILVRGVNRDLTVKDRVVRYPVTEILRSDGTVVRRIELKGDDTFPSRQQKMNDDQAQGLVSQVSLGLSLPAQDGNVYSLVRSETAAIYVITPAGEVLRKMEIKGDDPTQAPITMKVVKNRIAVFFRNNHTREQTIKVVDLEGNPITTYDASPQDKGQSLGPAFACYMPQTQEFTFLRTGDKDRLELVVAKP